MSAAPIIITSIVYIVDIYEGDKITKTYVVDKTKYIEEILLRTFPKKKKETKEKFDDIIISGNTKNIIEHKKNVNIRKIKMNDFIS